MNECPPSVKTGYHLLKVFESLRSSFSLAWCWALTFSKQLTNSLDVLLLLLLFPFKWHNGMATVPVVSTPLTFALALPPTFAWAKLPFFVCTWSICEISSTCSLISGVFTIFFTCSEPNGDGISCFKTVNADDNDRKESLRWEGEGTTIVNIGKMISFLGSQAQLKSKGKPTCSNRSCWLDRHSNRNQYHQSIQAELKFE